MKYKIQEAFDSLREYLVSHDYRQTPFLSVYANVDTTNPDNRRERPAWLVEVKNQFKQIAEHHGDELLKQAEPGIQWRDVEERIITTLLERDSAGRSVALFTDFVDKVIVDLPLPVITSAYYGIPQVKHLLSYLHRYGKYLVILFSEAEHRLIEVNVPTTQRELSVHTGLDAGVALRPGGHKARTQASERRDLDTERRVASQAAEEINRYFMKDPEFDRILFGGNLKIAHSVKNALHHTVAELLVTIEPIPLTATDKLIREIVQQVADEHEINHDTAVINDLVTRQETCGRGVTGTEGVMEALQNGQVRKLLIPFPIDSDVFDSLLVEAVLSNVEVELVHGPAADRLHSMGGVGAVLYYAIDEPT